MIHIQIVQLKQFDSCKFVQLDTDLIEKRESISPPHPSMHLGDEDLCPQGVFNQLLRKKTWLSGVKDNKMFIIRHAMCGDVIFFSVLLQKC